MKTIEEIVSEVPHQFKGKPLMEASAIFAAAINDSYRNDQAAGVLNFFNMLTGVSMAVLRVQRDINPDKGRIGALSFIVECQAKGVEHKPTLDFVEALKKNLPDYEASVEAR